MCLDIEMAKTELIGPEPRFSPVRFLLFGTGSREPSRLEAVLARKRTDGAGSVQNRRNRSFLDLYRSLAEDSANPGFRWNDNPVRSSIRELK